MITDWVVIIFTDYYSIYTVSATLKYLTGSFSQADPILTLPPVNGVSSDLPSITKTLFAVFQ